MTTLDAHIYGLFPTENQPLDMADELPCLVSTCLVR